MDSLNFTIDGQLGLPGFVRVPPPFGTPRNAVRTIQSTLARAQNQELSAAAAIERQMLGEQWRQRLTVFAIGVASTIAAALIGSHTGKHQQPLPHLDPEQHAAIAQMPVPNVPPEVLAADAASAIPASADSDTVETAPILAAQSDVTVVAEAGTKAQPAPVSSKLPNKSAKPRALARATGRTVASAAPVRSAAATYDEPVPIETYRAITDTAPVTSGFVAPDTPVRIELQRHTRLTD